MRRVLKNKLHILVNMSEASILRAIYRKTTDADLAHEVAAFKGDLTENRLVHRIIRAAGPLTLKTLAARPDVDVYRFDYPQGHTVVATLLQFATDDQAMARFLEAFPGYDVNAACMADGTTPLRMMWWPWWSKRFLPLLITLLNAGAEFAPDMLVVNVNSPRICWQTDPECIAAIAPYVAWNKIGERQAWIKACCRSRNEI